MILINSLVSLILDMYHSHLRKKKCVLETINKDSLQNEDTIQCDRKPPEICNMRDCTLK